MGRCVCGNTKIVSMTDLLDGLITSCGCRTRTGENIRDAITPHRKDGTYVPTITNLDHINSNNSSGFRGVKYRVYIRFQRRIYHLGYYDSLEDVVTVRKAAENRFFGDYQTD